MDKLQNVKNLTSKITISILNTNFHIRVERDNKDEKNGRIFIQIIYNAPCTKTGVPQEWHGRKWYLSDYMTDDEVIKTCFSAFKATVEHEIMEGFKVNGIILFNPHINYEELLSISNKEITRNNKGNDWIVSYIVEGKTIDTLIIENKEKKEAEEIANNYLKETNNNCEWRIIPKI